MIKISYLRQSNSNFLSNNDYHNSVGNDSLTKNKKEFIVTSVSS